MFALRRAQYLLPHICPPVCTTFATAYIHTPGDTTFIAAYSPTGVYNISMTKSVCLSKIVLVSCQSFCQSVHPLVCSSIHPRSFHPSVCHLFIDPSICPTFHPSDHGDQSNRPLLMLWWFARTRQWT